MAKKVDLNLAHIDMENFKSADLFQSEQIRSLLIEYNRPILCSQSQLSQGAGGGGGGSVHTQTMDSLNADVESCVTGNAMLLNGLFLAFVELVEAKESARRIAASIR
uniref:Uncharacterized protein n=1 Tax=Daphnia galeata TaxID=27404 RepID=A0A8J2S2T3_9CRUS|nr:unnamed protein product [Daphnia galeata]